MRTPGRPSAGAALAATMLLALVLAPAIATASGGPAITSDKDDYAPLDVVNLTGTSWGRGEAVSIVITGSDGLVHADDTVVAGDLDGSFVYIFTVPPGGIERFDVRATGESGATAWTSFTDANLQYATMREPSSGFVMVAAGGTGSFTIGARQLTLGGITPVVNDVAGGGYGLMARYTEPEPNQLNQKACGTASGPSGPIPVADGVLPMTWLGVTASPSGSPGLPYRMPARSDPAVPEDPYHAFTVQIAPPADATPGRYSAAVKLEGTATGNQWFALCVEVAGSMPAPAIDMETLVSVDGGATWNDADTPVGPHVLDGYDAPQFRFIVTNTGDVELTDLRLSDSDFDLDGCPASDPLAAGASFDCAISGTWAEGQHTDTATVSGMYGTIEVSDQDDTNYYGALAGIDLEKDVSVDGGTTWHEADGAPGPLGLSHTAPQFRFAVANTGNVTLTDVRLADNDLDLGGCTLADPLLAGASSECVISAPWTLGQHANTATASGRHTDDAGNVAQPVDSDPAHYFGMPAAAVTNGSFCFFDRLPTDDPWPVDIQQFRLVFTPDTQGAGSFRLSASNPGQFFYSAVYAGTPGEKVDVTFTLPFPFVTRGAKPLHVYDGVGIDLSGPVPCLQPGIPIRGAVGTSRTAATVSVGDAYDGLGDTAAVTATLTVPASGLILAVLHLDYGLEKTGGYARDASDNAEGPLGTDLIPNGHDYVFGNAANGVSASTAVQNANVFKRNPGVAGVVSAAGGGDPLVNVRVQLRSARGEVVGSAVTDEDGFYRIVYKHTGKAATYQLTLPDHGTVSPIILRANAFVEADLPVS